MAFYVRTQDGGKVAAADVCRVVGAPPDKNIPPNPRIHPSFPPAVPFLPVKYQPSFYWKIADVGKGCRCSTLPLPLPTLPSVPSKNTTSKTGCRRRPTGATMSVPTGRKIEHGIILHGLS